VYHDVQSSTIVKEEVKSTSAKIVAKEQDKLETQSDNPDDMLTALSTT
jgi:hypothetical protein